MAKRNLFSRLNWLWTPLTWVFVALNAFPIVWMVWCSLMGNNEILQGKTVPDPLHNDVFLVDTLAGNVLAGTLNGELFLYDVHNSGAALRHLDLGLVSTSYVRRGDDLWVIAADGGLEEVDLRQWKVVRTLTWNSIGEDFAQTDQTAMIERPGITRDAAMARLASSLNTEPLVAGSQGKSMAALVGRSFMGDHTLIDSLNALMANPQLLSQVLTEWQSVPSWFNPLIPWLYAQTRSPQQDRELFRWCLAERFPGEASRFLLARWNSIWVNRIPGSGHGTSVTQCGTASICFALWWEDFPGIGIADSTGGNIHWITEQHGLPSTSIQQLLPVGTHELLAISDAGLSLVDLNTRQIEANYLYGEYGLKYLDGRDVSAVLLDSSHVLLAYGQEAMNFEFRAGEGVDLDMSMLQGVSSDITDIALQDGRIYLGTSEGIFVMDAKDWTAPAKPNAPPLPIVKYTQLFQSASDHLTEDAVVHKIHLDGASMWLGGIFGYLSKVNLTSHQLEWHAQVPEGRFQLHWRNYQDLWRTIPFGKFLRNSIVICTSVMLIAMVVSSLASYALVRFEFPGRRFFHGAILATQMVPGILYLIPIFVVFTAIQQYAMIEMVNTWHGIIIVYSAFFIPMSTWILRGFFQSIPRELEEAALIDGCSQLGAFVRITLPAAIPGIVATGIYVFLLAWDELMFAWVLCTDTTTATIPVGIRLYVGQFGNRFDLLMAAASVATVPVMVLFFLMQRHIVSGLTGGAVKG